MFFYMFFLHGNRAVDYCSDRKGYAPIITPLFITLALLTQRQFSCLLKDYGNIFDELKLVKPSEFNLADYKLLIENTAH